MRVAFKNLVRGKNKRQRLVCLSSPHQHPVGLQGWKSCRISVHLWVGQIKRHPGVHPFPPQTWCLVPLNKGRVHGPGKMPDLVEGNSAVRCCVTEFQFKLRVI